MGALASNQTIELALRNLPSAVVILDVDGNVTWANPMACSMLGIELASMISISWASLFRVEEPRTDPMHPNESRRGVFREWGRIVRSDGSRLHIQKNEQALLGDDGLAIGTLISFNDNSEEQHYISRLERSRERAEEAAKTKTTFLANMSHELRTPLNSILGMSDLAQDLSTSREQQEYLSILRASAESLFQLISSLLDYIKLENGSTGLHQKSFKLFDFLDDTIAPLAVQCHAKGLGLHVVSDPDMENSLLGDDTRLRQILLNVLSNAYKFTDSGEIVLHVRQLTESHGPDSVMLEWTIKDTGIGISPENLFKIFDPFVQVDGSATRNAGGTGIGLSITKYLVELMQGNIVVKSTPKVGTSFVFTTQLSKGPRLSSHHGENILNRGSTVVLVSHSKAWIDSLLPWLNKAGIVVRTAASKSEMKAIIHASVDVPLFIFHGMYPLAQEIVAPGADADLQRLKERRHVVTVRLQRLEERLWHTAGFAYETLVEPVRSSRILSLLQILQAESLRDLEQKAHGDYRSPRPLHILYVEDDYLTASVHTDLMKSAGHQVTLSENGKEALLKLKDADFDLVIMDIEMPEMNGYELASVIRGGELGKQTSDIPLIALTAHSSPSDIKHAQVLGINAFLAKPFFPQSLLYTIDRILGENNVIIKPQNVSPDLHDSLQNAGLMVEHLDEVIRLLSENKKSDAEHILIEVRNWAVEKGRTDIAPDLLKALFKLRRNDVPGACGIFDALKILVEK